MSNTNTQRFDVHTKLKANIASMHTQIQFNKVNLIEKSHSLRVETVLSGDTCVCVCMCLLACMCVCWCVQHCGVSI